MLCLEPLSTPLARRQTATLRNVRPVPPFWEVRFDVEQTPRAGEYLLADLGGPVREPLFPATTSGDGFETAVPPGHSALRLLPGATVDVLGPLGRGFRLSPGGHSIARLLLVAGAEFLPLLGPLFQAAPSVVLVLEAATRAQLPSPQRFPPSLELTLVTRDGSAGYLGPLEAEGSTPAGLERAYGRLCELIAWAERICVAHDPVRYPALATIIQRVRLHPHSDLAQAIVQVPMPCGSGVCDVCRVTTRHGEKRACVDGPVFDLLDFLPL